MWGWWAGFLGVPYPMVESKVPTCVQGIEAFDASRQLDSLPEPAPAAGASVHAWRLIEVRHHRQAIV
jgi:hypothetical protein